MIIHKIPLLNNPFERTDPRSNRMEHHVVTGGPPVAAVPLRLAPDNLAFAKSEFVALIASGILRLSDSPLASLLQMALKKDGISWRPCGDYCALNLDTCFDSYPTPYIDDITESLHRTTVSKNDSVQTYHQIPVAAEDVEKDVAMARFCLCEFLLMAFGLRYAAQAFQRFIDSITQGLDFVHIYIDDLLTAPPNVDEHIQHLTLLYQSLSDSWIVVSPGKCELGKTELPLLATRSLERALSLAWIKYALYSIMSCRPQSRSLKHFCSQ